MKLEIYAVHDTIAQAFLSPFFMQNEGLATRDFIDAANRPESRIYNHPQDFTLYHIGYWDDNSAEFELNHTPRRIANALELKAHQEQQTELFQHEVSHDAQLSGDSQSNNSPQ